MDALKKNGWNPITNYAYIPQRNRMQAIPHARQTYLHLSSSFTDLFPKRKSAKSYDTHPETAFLF